MAAEAVAPDQRPREMRRPVARDLPPPGPFSICCFGRR